MKFLADENVDSAIVARLRKEGHTVLYVIEMSPSISDDEVVNHVNKEEALLLTADKDFGELVFRQGRIVQGVVLLRLAGLSPAHKADMVASAIGRRGDELSRNFTVITQEAIRIRHHHF